MAVGQDSKKASRRMEESTSTIFHGPKQVTRWLRFMGKGKRLNMLMGEASKSKDKDMETIKVKTTVILQSIRIR
jgi:hypothetical protein